MSKDLRVCPGVGARKCGAFLARLDCDPHPTCTRCRGKVCNRDMTCDFCAVWSAEQWELFAKKRFYKERKQRPSGSAPPAQQTSPRAETSSGVSRPGTSSSSSCRPLGGQEKQGGSRGAPGVVLGGAPSPPARLRSSERSGSASRHSSGAGGLAPSSPPPSGGGGAGVARSRQTPLSRVSESVDSPQFSPHVPRRENSRESSVSCSRVLSSRDSRSSGRGSRKDKRARSREGSSRGRRRRSRSRSSSRSRSRGRERVRLSSSASRSSRGRSRRERSRSSDRYRSRRGSSRSRRDRYRSRRDRSRRERSRSFDRYRSRRERTRSPARREERRYRSRSHALPRSGGRLPASPARLRAEEAVRLARRGAQEGVEAVASQPPVAPGEAAGVTPVARGAPMTALPSAMRELAKFFLNLSGSSSLGATGDLAGVTASAAASGGIACPSSTAAGAATICAAAVTPAGAGVLSSAPAAVSGVSGEQQRQGESRSRGRRSRSSGEGTDRRAKKRPRRRSPSSERSSRRRGKRYRSSSDSSEEDRADASPPRSRHAHGGARTGGSSWDFDRSRSSAREERDRSGARPGPSGVADDDRSSTFESVDFARDDSFRAVLGLIREFHDMAEPATVPAARCKTSLASAYGLMSETSPAFTLPVSPLLSTLLLDINSDLSKFLEDQTVHGFLPVPGRRHRRYYGTSTSYFPGPYTVPPGVTSITMEKASEVRKRSVSLSASQVSSMETMLSGMCEVSSWLDWWLSTCGGFRDHLPIEVRADFERLMISGSRALEFLASQGCTTLGNLVLARRDALLADVRGTVPAEEVARLRYSPLPQSAAIFPHALLDSALLKMRAAASDALVQRTLHPPRIPRKPASAGQSGGSSTARSGQASTSGASQAQKQSASSSTSGQSGQGKKKGKGKAPFSSSSRGSGRSGGKGKGAGKKSA